MKKMKEERTPEIVKIKNIIMGVLNENGFSDAEIILFGSRAKGDFRTHSDWDFLIVLKEQLDRKEKLDLVHKIGMALVEIYVPCDILIRSEDEVAKRKNVVGSVIRSATRTGVML